MWLNPTASHAYMNTINRAEMCKTLMYESHMYLCTYVCVCVKCTRNARRAQARAQEDYQAYLQMTPQEQDEVLQGNPSRLTYHRSARFPSTTVPSVTTRASLRTKSNS
jgi:hypothetical protein